MFFSAALSGDCMGAKMRFTFSKILFWAITFGLIWLLFTPITLAYDLQPRDYDSFKRGLGQRDRFASANRDTVCKRLHLMYGQTAFTYRMYCFDERNICGHLDQYHAQLEDEPAYQQCATKMWPLVRTENWDALYNLTEAGQSNPRRTKTTPQPKPRPAPRRSARGPALDHGGYADIDDMSTDDIDVLEVRAPPRPVSQTPRKKYCGCRGDDPELYGFCHDVKRRYNNTGTYDLGTYPWTAQCKITVQG